MDFFNAIWYHLQLFFNFFVAFFVKKNCEYGYVGENCNIECGLFFSGNTKIIGGIDSQPNAWPSQVSIGFTYRGYVLLERFNRMIYVNQYNRFICGGSLIDINTGNLKELLFF
jgi:hypothetical protein